MPWVAPEDVGGGTREGSLLRIRLTGAETGSTPPDETSAALGRTFADGCSSPGRAATCSLTGRLAAVCRASIGSPVAPASVEGSSEAGTAAFHARQHSKLELRFARKGAVAKVTSSAAQTSDWRPADRSGQPHRGATTFRPQRWFSGLNSRESPANVGNREWPVANRGSLNALQIGTIRANWSPESHPGGRRFESG